jgi:hypothetical protein
VDVTVTGGIGSGGDSKPERLHMAMDISAIPMTTVSGGMPVAPVTMAGLLKALHEKAVASAGAAKKDRKAKGWDVSVRKTLKVTSRF